MKEVKVTIKLPNSASNKQTNGFQKISTVSDITKVTIDVNSSNNNIYVGKLMSRQNGKWSVTLLLDPTQAPFTFTVKGYESDGTERYRGVLQNITASDLDKNIIVPINRIFNDGESVLLPSLTNIQFNPLANGRVNLHFTIDNQTQDLLEFNLTTLNLPPSCTSHFTPQQGTIIVGQKSFDSIYKLDSNQSCNGDSQQLTLINSATKSSVKILFNLNNNLGGISINFPPQLENFVTSHFLSTRTHSNSNSTT